jgi:hypothetical protein
MPSISFINSFVNLRGPESIGNVGRLEIDKSPHSAATPKNTHGCSRRADAEPLEAHCSTQQVRARHLVAMWIAQRLAQERPIQK